MNIFKSISLFILVGVFSLGSLEANITGVTGFGVIISPPTTLGNGQPGLYLGQNGFTEKTVSWNAVNNTHLSLGSIAEGALVQSHMIALVENDNATTNVTWTFNAPIVALMWRDFAQTTMSNVVGHPSTTYSGTIYGMDPNTGTPDGSAPFYDNLSTIVLGSSTSITVSMYATTAALGDVMDSLRVITQVPEPSTYLLLGSMLMIAGVAKKKKQALARS